MSHSNATFEEEDLSALLDGELSPAERAALESRLQGDPALQAELDAIAEAREFLAEHGPVSAPPDLLGSILAAAEAEDAGGGNVVSFPWYKRPLGVPIAGWAVAAAAVLVVYVAMPSFESGPSTDARTAAQAPMKQTLDKADAVPTTEDAVATLEPDAEQADDVDAAQADEDGVAVLEQDEVVEKSKKALPPDALELSTRKALTVPPQDKLAETKLAKKKLLGEKNEAAKKPSKLIDAEQAPASAGGTEEGAAFARVPYQYTVYTDDPQALMQLEAIAGRYQGELAGPGGIELEEQLGTEAATVIVKIPAHALQDFGRSIQSLGNVYQASDNRVFAGDPVEVRVRVQLAAGNADAKKMPPNAARQKAEAAYEVDQLE